MNAEIINDACKKKNPLAQIEVSDFNSAMFEKIVYNDWYELVNSTINMIKKLIKDILILSESVDTDLLEALTHLDDTSRWLIYKKNSDNKNLDFASHHLNRLKNDSNSLIKSFYKAYGKYTTEYHTDAIKRNREFIEQGRL